MTTISSVSSLKSAGLTAAWSSLVQWSGMPFQMLELYASFAGASESISITATSSTLGHSLGPLTPPNINDASHMTWFAFLSAAYVEPPSGGTLHFSLMQSSDGGSTYTTLYSIADVTTAGPVMAFQWILNPPAAPPSWNIVAWVSTGTGTIKAQQYGSFGDGHIAPVLVGLGKVG